MAGYSQDELDDVQAKWGLRFRPDLIDRLRERRPLLVSDPDPRSFDWVTADPKHIRERLASPFESYWRSIEPNDIGDRNGARDRLLPWIRRRNCVASSPAHRSSFHLRAFATSQKGHMKARTRCFQSANPVFFGHGLRHNLLRCQPH
jgi:hypothetical protein